MLIDWLPGAALALDPLTILLLALAFDAALGDPRWLYRALPHPIALLGRAIEAGERALNHPDLAGRSRFWRGFGLTLALVFLAAGFGRLIESLLATFSGGWIIEALLASSLIAFRSLHDHVRAVANGLERSLEDGRMAVSHIVGRDPQSLDQAGIARAAAESTAENFSDGLVAPVFWFAAFGLAGLCAYKTVNTLDSMIGYRSERHEAFGKAAARLDDALNWVPARLAGLLWKSVV